MFDGALMRKIGVPMVSGDTFGDLALKKPKLPRRLSVVAVKDTSFAVLNKEAYDVCIFNRS